MGILDDRKQKKKKMETTTNLKKLLCLKKSPPEGSKQKALSNAGTQLSKRSKSGEVQALPLATDIRTVEFTKPMYGSYIQTEINYYVSPNQLKLWHTGEEELQDADRHEERNRQ